MSDFIRDFLNKNNTIALVGASNNPEKYGYKIFKDLTEFGYKVIPINPKEETIQQVRAYRSLTAVLQDNQHIDVVNFVVPPAVTLQVLEECLLLDLMAVWFQPGSSDDSVLKFCELQHFQYVHDVCMMVEKTKVR